ncbi:MAG: HAD hydrolase-like protein [Ruthenibacterium lactatiformans]
MVGDRLYTDIALGACGCGTALVLCGETTPEALRRHVTPGVVRRLAALGRLLWPVRSIYHRGLLSWNTRRIGARIARLRTEKHLHRTACPGRRRAARRSPADRRRRRAELS